MKYWFSDLSMPMRWLVLLSFSIPLYFIFHLGHFPAAVLLSCMFAAIVVSLQGITLFIPKWNFAIAQGVVGCLMARSLKPEVLSNVIDSWPIFVAVSLAVFSASAILGWVFTRRGIFPGSTAVWGLAPGAAAAMVIMAEAYGADVRLVAFMQYLRVASVTTIAAVIAHFYAVSGVVESSISTQWFFLDFYNFATTLFLVIGVSLIAFKLSIPGGAMFLPLTLGVVLQFFGFVVIDLPIFLLTAAYAVIGWSIGLRFNRAILRHAWQTLPQVLTAISLLIILSGLIAISLWHFQGFDLFTAYLASSPGGADSVAVIAATTTVNTGFVMSMQLSRFLFVLIFGPMVSKYVATRAVKAV